MILEIPKKKNAKYKPYLVTVKNSLKIINVHYQTLYKMEERGEIEVVRSKGVIDYLI